MKLEQTELESKHCRECGRGRNFALSSILTLGGAIVFWILAIWAFLHLVTG